MTIRLLCAYSIYPVNAIVTLDAGTEAGLVAAKRASTNTAGGTVYVPPVQPNQIRAANLVFDPAGNVLGLAGPNNAIIAIGGSTATKPGQPAKPVLTAMAGAVSVAWTPGAAGSTATTGNIWTDINGNVTQLTTNPQTITAPAGTPYTGTVATVNAQGAGPASAQADAVTPTLPASNIQYAQNVQGMLASIRSSSTLRKHLAYIGMSNDFGAGSQGPTSNDWGEVAFSTQSIVPRASAYINTARGGTFTRGIEVVGGFSDSSPLNPFFSLGGGAALTAKYGAAGGPSGMAVPLSGGTANTLSFPMTSAFAGQVVKIYGYTTGGVGGIVPRYSLSGANTQATTNLPASTTAAPIAGLPYYWYETTLTMANAGTTTVTLLAPVASGASFVVWGADPDVRNSAGLTIHRLCKAGEVIGTLLGDAIDDTDANPPGIWTSNASKAAFRAAQTASLTTRVGVSGVFISCLVNEILGYANNAGAYGFQWVLNDIRRHMTNAVNSLKAKGLECIIVVEAIRNPNTYSVVGGSGTPFTQTDILNVYKEVAAASTNCGLLDLTEQFLGATEMDTYNNQIATLANWLPAEATAGSGGTAYAPAYVHYSNTGHGFYGNQIGTQVNAAAG